jgi:Ca2+-binding EF-hand superfamily protein
MGSPQLLLTLALTIFIVFDFQEAAGAKFLQKRNSPTAMNYIDTNHDGRLSLPEFLAATEKLRPEINSHANHGDFYAKFTDEEFREQIKKEFQRADTSGDGYLSFPEFRVME